MKSDHDVPIVFAFDHGFARYASVAAASLLANANRPVDIFCITSGVSHEALEGFRCIARRFSAAITLHEVDLGFFATWRTGAHFTCANYLRLLIPDLIDRPTALYLDGDIVVTTDLDELIATELGSEHWIAGCVDQRGTRASQIKRSEGEPYLNSGVMLMNLQELRQANFYERSRAFYETNIEEVMFVDQCVINGVAGTKKLTIDERWNVMINDYSRFDLERQIGHFEGCGIIHANGPIKPWMSWSDPWLSKLWASYIKLTNLKIEDLLISPRSLEERSLKARSLEHESKWAEAASLRGEVMDEFWGRVWDQYRATWDVDEAATEQDRAMRRQFVQDMWDAIWTARV